MKIETGHPTQNNVQPVDGEKVRFVTDDGETTLFEVSIASDDCLLIRGVECIKIGKKFIGPSLSVEPHVSNTIRIRLI